MKTEELEKQTEKLKKQTEELKKQSEERKMKLEERKSKKLEKKEKRKIRQVQVDPEHETDDKTLKSDQVENQENNNGGEIQQDKLLENNQPLKIQLEDISECIITGDDIPEEFYVISYPNPNPSPTYSENSNSNESSNEINTNDK